MSTIGKAARRAISFLPPAPKTRAGGHLPPGLTAVPRGRSGRAVSHCSKSSPGCHGEEKSADSPEPSDLSLGWAAVQRWRGSGSNSSQERRRPPAASESKQSPAHWYSTPPEALGRAGKNGLVGVGQAGRWARQDKIARGSEFDGDTRRKGRGVGEGRPRPGGESRGRPNPRYTRHGSYRDGESGIGVGDVCGTTAAAAAPAGGGGGDLGQASIMRRLKQAKHRRDAEGAKRILDAALAQNDAEEVVDVYVYSAAVGVFAKTGRWEAALGVLAAMRERGVQPNAFTYNQAIAACGNGGAWEWAVYLLKAMPKVRVAPDVVSYNAAIAACAAGKQPELAEVLLREMTPGVAPNAVTYGAAMSAIVGPSASGGGGGGGAAAAAASSHWRRALQLLEEMREARVAPDVACYGPAVAACAAADRVDEAMELLGQMQREDGLVPDLDSYNAVVAACRRAKKWEQAVVLLGEMKSAEGVNPDGITYTEVVAACRQAGQPGLAADLLNEIREARRA